MSKGSKQRPTDKLRFDQNYNNINWNRDKLTNEQMVSLLAEVKKMKQKRKYTNEDNTRD